MNRSNFSRWIAASIVCGSASVAFGQTSSEMTLRRWSPGVFGETTDKLLYQEQGHVKGEDDRGAQIFWWDSTGRFRFDKQDPNALTLGYRYLTINYDTNSPTIPDTLDELSLAAAMHLGEVGGFKTTAILGAGYSGDNLFASEDGLFGIGHLQFERQINETDSYVLSVDYDGSSALLPDVPLPGFAFIHREENFSYTVGFPYNSLHWQIAPKLALDAKYTVPYSGEATLEYTLGDGFSVFGNVTNFFNAFYQQEARREERIFYEMRRAEIGLRYINPDVYRGLALDAALLVGYAFDQRFSTGWDVRDTDGLANISDEPYIGILVRGTF